MWQIAWVLAFGLCLGALGLAPGQRSQRRSHFWLRLVAIALIPGCALSITSAIVPIWRMQVVTIWLYLMAIPALILLPALLFRPSGPPPGSTGDEGGGPGPGPPPPAPARPRGGIPLPDAEPARARVRDHVRPRLVSRQARRRAREPTPAPRQVPAR
jgi:hypothetical protein